MSTQNTTDAASSALAGLLALPAGLTMDNTYGAALLGTFFALMLVFLPCSRRGPPTDDTCRLYGVLLHQTYNYLRVYSGDNFWLKSYVRASRVCL